MEADGRADEHRAVAGSAVAAVGGRVTRDGGGGGAVGGRAAAAGERDQQCRGGEPGQDPAGQGWHETDARRLGEESLAAFRELGDPDGEAAALNNLLITAHAQSDFAGSLAYGQAALVLAEAGGDRRRIAATENNIAATLRNLG
ncbi:MAG TPA: hypothetical protein VGP36_19855, partial [Mycobacteriales bacterium]|nr:hypothetical protein [Mycobacteriales bacterium]